MGRTHALVVGMILSLTAREAAAKYIDIQNAETRARAIKTLRQAGPEGLDVALGFYDELAKEQRRLKEVAHRLIVATSANATVGRLKGRQISGAPENSAEVQRQLADVTARLATWRGAIDLIGGGRTCSVSRLYWYTDLAAAQAEAKRSCRPILSLRMLGKLTDEFSCANSRFFRTALYSNSEISKYLRENYVLHWQSVRPVPRVKIDFGDGRKLERTLTGNSAHYVLTSDGQPLDVLPGLYSPQAFAAWLKRMQQFHAEYAAAAERPAKLAAFHAERRRIVYRTWLTDIERLGNERAALVASRIDRAIESATAAKRSTPIAMAAARLAATKTDVEAPLLRFANFNGPWLETGMDDEIWQAIAQLRRRGVKLDQASVDVMRREFPIAAQAGKLAYSKSVQEDPVLRVMRVFEDSIALDTVRNEYLLHRRIHEQFAEAADATANIDALNEWVYAELFLTPSSDPWLGLAPANVYTALENDGRTEVARTISTRSGSHSRLEDVRYNDVKDASNSLSRSR
jgi:hypothetical protein